MFFFKQKTAYEMRISDWSSDVCSSDLRDYIRCEADLRAGRIASFDACNQSFVTTGRRAGNPDLKAETSTTWTIGTVLEPPVFNSGHLRTTFTMDFWQVRSEEHTSELQSLMRISYAVFCLKKKKTKTSYT